MKLHDSIERFICYAKICTESNPNNYMAKPSSENQWDLLKMLHKELLQMGVDSTLEENGNLFVKMRTKINKNAPKIGFLAHVDTSPEFTGKDVKPQIVYNYDGKEIVLNQDVILNPIEFPELLNYVGKTIITTDGTTLLGADDKAGVTEIMEVIKYLNDNPELKHGELRFGFTTDEEIGRGIIDFDIEKFDANFAFTMDGGEVGGLEYENFNAAIAVLNIQGYSIHPGIAKNKMINSSIVATEFINLLPKERPENTELYEGFVHVTNIKSDVKGATITMIIRDHDKIKFEEKKEYLKKITLQLQHKFQEAILKLEITDEYFNMKEKIEENSEIMKIANRGFEIAGIEPKILPFRGGTDGSDLSFIGLPCPNIFAGGHNFHGRFEYLPAESMIDAQNVIMGIIKAAIE